MYTAREKIITITTNQHKLMKVCPQTRDKSLGIQQYDLYIKGL